MQRPEDQLIRKLTEAQVPPLSPELCQRRRAQRSRHDGLCIDTKSLPRKSDQLERPEVQQQDQSEHARPTAQQRFCPRKRARHDPQKDRAKPRFKRRPKPRRKSRRRNALLRIQESVRIHSRPSEKISQRTPSRMSNSGPRPPPRQPLEAEKEGERQSPREHPRQQPIAARNCRQRQHHDRKPANPLGTSRPRSGFDFFWLSLRQNCHSLPDRRTS